MTNELFNRALGVEEPLYVEKVDFDLEKGELHIRMNFKRGGRFACPECGAGGQGVYDTEEKRWRHLNFFQHRCYIHLRTPRVECGECGQVHQWMPPWGRSGSGFTLLFESYVMALAQAGMTMAGIGGLVGEDDKRIWRIVEKHVAKAREGKVLAEVKRVGVDETSSRKGHNYITVFADMEKGEVVYATEGKGAATVKAFGKELMRRGGRPRQVEEMAMDMSPAFISGVQKWLRNARVTFDKFHVVMGFNKVLDGVRRTETRDKPELKNTRYIWLKNRNDLTVKQEAALESLSRSNLKTGRVYRMKLALQEFYNLWDGERARQALGKWLGWADRSRIEAVKEFAKMVKKHREGILRYFATRLTSGAMESINGRIQQIKRRGRGYRNISNFITMIYLVLSNLDFNLPPCFTHTK